MPNQLCLPRCFISLYYFEILQSLRAYRLRRLNITKVQNRNQGREDRHLDVMVIVVVLVFLMCHRGYPVTRFIKDTGINSHQSIPCPIVVFNTVSALLNSSINCLIYITFMISHDIMRHDEATLCHRSLSTLLQLVVCCLMARNITWSKRHLSNRTIANKLEWEIKYSTVQPISNSCTIHFRRWFVTCWLPLFIYPPSIV